MLSHNCQPWGVYWFSYILPENTWLWWAWSLLLVSWTTRQSREWPVEFSLLNWSKANKKMVLLFIWGQWVLGNTSLGQRKGKEYSFTDIPWMCWVTLLWSGCPVAVSVSLWILPQLCSLRDTFSLELPGFVPSLLYFPVLIQVPSWYAICLHIACVLFLNQAWLKECKQFLHVVSLSLSPPMSSSLPLRRHCSPSTQGCCYWLLCLVSHTSFRCLMMCAF